MGLLMQSNFAKSDGIKSDLRIRLPKSSDFGPNSADSTEHHLRTRSLFRFSTNYIYFATRPKSEAQNRIRIIISLRPRRSGALRAVRAMRGVRLYVYLSFSLACFPLSFFFLCSLLSTGVYILCPTGSCAPKAAYLRTRYNYYKISLGGGGRRSD